MVGRAARGVNGGGFCARTAIAITSNVGLTFGQFPSRMRRNAPDRIPVSVIGRLAVSRQYAGKGLGAYLLADALRRIASASRIIGVGAVMVHAKTDAAKRFYLRCAEFIEYPQDSRILFLPIETVFASFG
jgi:GNAT superfamily N-acetyltransferase